MIIFAQDGETFINSNAARYYKIVDVPDGAVLRAYMTRGESVLLAHGARNYLLDIMKKVSQAINNGEAYYEITIM